jgi:hypothetical protein
MAVHKRKYNTKRIELASKDNKEGVLPPLLINIDLSYPIISL